MPTFTPYQSSGFVTTSNPRSRLDVNNDLPSQPIVPNFLQPHADKTDAYILHPLLITEPCLPISDNKLIQPNATIHLGLQRYHYDENRRFIPVFPSSINLYLYVVRFFNRQDDNIYLPYQLDAHLLNAQEIAEHYLDDPVLSTLDQSHRLVFRYDHRQNVGCMVHIGKDLTPYDQSKMTLFWLTAVNRDRDKPKENRNGFANASEAVSVILPPHHKLL